jgi:hypothetical protein
MLSAFVQGLLAAVVAMFVTSLFTDSDPIMYFVGLVAGCAAVYDAVEE